MNKKYKAKIALIYSRKFLFLIDQWKSKIILWNIQPMSFSRYFEFKNGFDFIK